MKAVSKTIHSATPRLLGVAEAANLIGLSPWTLRLWSYQGKIPSHKISTRLLFDRSDIEQLITASRRPATEESPT